MHRERFVAIVDSYHAVEHLQKVADLSANGSDAKRRDWMARSKKLLRAGRVERVIQAIHDPCVGRRAEVIQTERNDFVCNIERMRDRDLEHRSMPIGSGAAEGAVRRIVNLRYFSRHPSRYAGCEFSVSLQPPDNGIESFQGFIEFRLRYARPETPIIPSSFLHFPTARMAPAARGRWVEEFRDVAPPGCRWSDL